MKREDFLSIVAVRSPEIQELFRQAIDGEISKSYFVEEFMRLPHVGRNKKKAKGAKSAVYHAEWVERYFGWVVETMTCYYV